MYRLYMKLLILGLILIGILLVQIYYINKNKETFQSEVEKALVAGERNFMKGQDKYWDVRSQGIGSGLVTTKPGINDWLRLDEKKELKKYTPKIGLEQRQIDKGITNCRALTKCSQLSNNNCGYCAFDKEFRFGTKNGPSADVCPKDAWTTDSNKCQELREKEICSNVKSCGDLYGEAAKLCGYCPTSGQAMVMKKVGDKYYPKYGDDTCNADGYGLIPGDKCGKFLKDHPCITPYYLSGPHSAQCVEKLWKNSKCTDKTPYGKTYEDLGKSIKMPYKEAGTIMQQTNAKTRSTDYYVAVDNSKFCFGNSNNIDPCDPKYARQGIPHPECLKKEFIKVGCKQKGTGYNLLKAGNTSGMWGEAKKQVGDISKYSKAQSAWNRMGFSYPFSTSTNVKEYQQTMKRVYNLTVEAEDYDTRKETSMHCLGEAPPKPPAIKAGDSVTKIVGDMKFEGIVIRLRGANCEIMWHTKTDLVGGVITKREGSSLEEQKQIWGWDGISPTGKTDLKTTYNKARLTQKKICGTNKSSCKMTCKDKIRDMLYRFPRPRDCIVGDWGGWSKCSKTCGGGQEIRRRKILYPPKFGGAPCPTLENKRICNTTACMNPNFTEKPKLSLINRTPGWNVPYSNNSTRGGTSRLLGECEGDCDGDAQCLPGLKCKERNGYESVPNCTGSGTKGWDYCYAP